MIVFGISVRLTANNKATAMTDLQKTPFVRELASSGMSQNQSNPSSIAYVHFASHKPKANMYRRQENPGQSHRLPNSLPPLQKRPLSHRAP